MTQDELWHGFFAEHFGHRRAARAAFEASGVTARHAAVNPVSEDVSGWSTARRMERYVEEAAPLAKAALVSALDDAQLSPAAIGQFVVVSCTGYATPGLDVTLARDLGMAPSARRVSIGHMGCHAALPGLAVADDHVVSNGTPAVLLSLELSSLHLQPATTDVGQAVVHSLFGDAASAVVLEAAGGEGRRGLELVDADVRTDVASIDDMTWTITDRGFRMTLSRRVGEAVARGCPLLVDELLERNGLSRAQVDAWAVHPGGPRVLDAVGDALGLDRGDLAPSRQVLAEHGNCSSATILLVLDAVRRRLGPAPGRSVVALAFGPGLTLCAVLLRTTSPDIALPRPPVPDRG